MVTRFVTCLALVIVSLGSVPAGATSAWQNFADPVFVHTDTRELPEAAVMALAQDSDGLLWVGTQGGLARFDGYHFLTYLPDPRNPRALPDSYIRSLVSDGDRGLWIGSLTSGLVHFDAASETFHTWRPDPSGVRGPRSASVNALARTPDGSIWVGGDHGVSRYDPGSDTFSPAVFAGRRSEPLVLSMLTGADGRLWVGTQTGLYVRRPGSTVFALVTIAGSAAPTISSLADDQRGHLWAGGLNALYELNPDGRLVASWLSSSRNRESLAPGPQLAVVEISPGIIWAGTDSALSVVDATTHAVHRVDADVQSAGGLTGGRIVQFLRGRSGLVWIANHVGGLLSFNPSSRGLYQLFGSRPEIGFGDKGAIAVAALSGDRLAVGGFSGRLTTFDARTVQSTTATLPNRQAIQTVEPDATGTLWVGTTAGLCRLDGASTSCPARPPELASPSIYAILAEGETLSVGGAMGLLTVDRRSDTAAPYAVGDAFPFANSQVRVIKRDRNHRLWLGTENGLERIDPGGRLVSYVFTPGDPNSIGPGGVATITEDRRGRIWAGANGGPLNVLEPTADGSFTIRHVGLADGMPHENVDGIAEDPSGRIWASTDKGIALIDPVTLKARALGLADGVSNDAYWAGAVARSADGTIFFGGLDGVTVIAPHASSAWRYAPPLIVSALHIGKRNLSTWGLNRDGAHVDLPGDARDISVEFAALDYSAPQSLHYAYRLEGYDRDWIDVDALHRVATYTHLPPGDYALDVRATNRVGVWSTHELHLGIHAIAAWYETWWFRLAVVLAIVLAAYTFYRARTAVLRRRQHELERMVADRTRELSEANARLLELSVSDPLTGLRNRRFLAQHLESDVVMTLRRYDDWRNGSAVSEVPDESDVLFFLVDLDNLKVVNDRYGHLAGDAVLIQMRDRLQEVFRESDFVVRWGGDEFLAVARASRRHDAAMIAERIRNAVAGRPFTLDADQVVDASVSIGFAAFPFVPSAPHGVTWMQTIGLADHALYMAKQAGRNAWFGLAATERSDPEVIVRRLASSADELVAAANLDVIATVRVS
jgi:diguanylate cyclase (GGDEF)-like protein